MNRYRIWLDSYLEVERYLEYLSKKKAEREDPKVKENYKMCKALSFMIDDEVKNSFSLEEIDLITARYFDKDDFLMPIVEEIFSKDSAKVIKIGKPLVTYKANGTLRELDIVYDSPLLMEYAKKEHKNKKDKTNENKRIEDTEALQKFCNQLLSIIKDKTERCYILQPDDVDMASEKKQMIKRMLPKKMITGNQSFSPITLYETLKNYALSYDARCKKQEQGIATSQDDESLTHHQIAVYHSLRKDYKTLRNAVLLVKLYDEVSKKTKENENDYYDQMTLSFSSPYESFEYQEYLNTQNENDDILREMAEEKRNIQEQRSCHDEPIIDDYSFEETEKYVDTPLRKGLKKNG